MDISGAIFRSIGWSSAIRRATAGLFDPVAAQAPWILARRSRMVSWLAGVPAAELSIHRYRAVAAVVALQITVMQEVEVALPNGVHSYQPAEPLTLG